MKDREQHLHLPRFFYSLRLRLLTMFLLIVLVTVGLVSLFADLNTAGSFNAYVQKVNLTTRTQIVNWLNDYNRKAGSHPDPAFEQWMVEQFMRDYHVPVFVVTPAGQVIASPEKKWVGSTITQASLQKTAIAPGNKQKAHATISCVGLGPSSIVVSTNATIFCPNSLAIATGSSNTSAKSISTGSGDSPERTFLNSVSHSLLTGVFLAGLIALILALTFSYTLIKPIKRMTAVARRMEGGDLSQRLTVKKRDELGELAHALNTMATGLQRSEHLRRNMIHDIAHELRTPLTNIRGYLEALEDQVVEPTPAIISSLYEESSLLTRLVADLQELSLAEAGQLCLARRPLFLRESILKAVQMVRLQAEQKQIELQVELPAALPQVEADPERVAQVLRNLLANALTHTPAGGIITVNAVNDEDAITISVRDSGCGIEAQHLPYIFERFYRADPSRTRTTGGSGLGLAIVKQVVQAHNGQVHVESQTGRGSCFSFTLPILA